MTISVRIAHKKCVPYVNASYHSTCSSVDRESFPQLERVHEEGTGMHPNRTVRGILAIVSAVVLCVTIAGGYFYWRALERYDYFIARKERVLSHIHNDVDVRKSR